MLLDRKPNPAAATCLQDLLNNATRMYWHNPTRCLPACSAVLPVSSAFASTGIVAGFVIMVVVAAANAYTCDLLLWEAYKTGMHDYETLSYAVGGGVWKVCWDNHSLLAPAHARQLIASTYMCMSLLQSCGNSYVLQQSRPLSTCSHVSCS